MKHTVVRDLISVLSALALGALLALVGPSASAFGQDQLPATESSDSNDSNLASPDSCDNYSLARWVHVPIMDYIGNDYACSTWIEVQAVGAVPRKAAQLTWAEPGFCPPQPAAA